ncbi:unnamed protein product [Moneuplotes crassus]|uniref:Type 1 phosphatases regulator n=1 Tax=Euplotes crassus TaxID=5936 RepID=A0AAD2D8P9_EUPCR|nr:unnamed protein product [Moneuplotes crassus]
MENTQIPGTSNTELTNEETKGPEVINFQVKNKQKVKWDENVIDNENMGKKKSKICCIYRPRRENRSCSSSSDSSCSSSDDANKYDRYPKHQKKLMREKKEKKMKE